MNTFSLLAIAIADNDSLVGHIDSGPVDLLLCLGDLSDATIKKAYARYQPGRTYGVRGNHDPDVPFPDFVTDLHGKIEQYRGLIFGGFGGAWQYKPRGHHLLSQDEVSRIMLGFPRVDVFIAHNSPRGYHEFDDDIHQGFDAFLAYIELNQPRYFIHAHQHLSRITQIGATTLIGVYGEAEIELDPPSTG
jgi:calcineurin-like phosphoesterase family protein